MAKNTYFGHSFTLAHSPGMFYIISNGGLKDYGRAFILIEMLGNDNNILDLNDKPLSFMLAKKLECEIEELETIIDRFVESGLFEIKDNVLSSHIVTEAYNIMAGLSEKNRQNALKRHKPTNETEYKRPQATASGGKRPQANTNEAERTKATPSQTVPIEIEKEIEIETEKEKEPVYKEKDNDNNTSPNGDVLPPQASERISSSAVEKIMELYNSITVNVFPEAKVMTEKRSKLIKNLIKKRKIEIITAVFQKAAESDFLCGRTKNPFNGCDFDWIINESNFVKILEGKYDNGKYKEPLPPAIAGLKEANEKAKANGGNAEGAIW